MKSFKDLSGRTWDVEVKFEDIKRVKARIDVDLCQMFTKNDSGKMLLDRLSEDLFLAVDVIFCLCRAEEKGVSDEEFASVIDGEIIAQAMNVIVEAVIDFFPPARRTQLIRFKKQADRLAEWETRKLSEIPDDEIFNCMKQSITLPESPA